MRIDRTTLRPARPSRSPLKPRHVLPCAALALLAACSGGGGGGGGSAGVEALAGSLIPDPVSGLRFETPTQSGVTDDSGRFRYLEGETVRLFVGDIELGAFPGAPAVDLFGLTGSARIEDTRALEASMEDGSFSRQVNTAVLLHTLDRDGDPKNGIEIPPEVAAEALGVAVDFERDPESFRRHRPVRGLLNRCNAAGHFPGVRSLRSGALALQRFYGEGPTNWAPELAEIDQDADGTVDYTSFCDFDARGFQVERRVEQGTPPEAETYRYVVGPEGFQLLVELDPDDDGVFEQRLEFLYDETFDLVGIETRDEAGDLQSSFEFDRNEFGEEVARRSDGDGDGVVDSVRTNEFDARGNVVRISLDNEGDGVVDTIFASAYDERDLRIEEAYDANADGVVDRLDRFTYDEAGLLVRFESDVGADGQPDVIETKEYDEHGLRIREEFDTDADGVADSIRTMEYDEEGRLVETAFDNNGDGQLDRVDRNEYDGLGDLIRTEEDQGADGTPDKVTDYSYDAAGNRIRIEIDLDADGVLDIVHRYTYREVAWGWRFVD